MQNNKTEQLPWPNFMGGRIRIGLNELKKFLYLIGDPHLNLPPVIHIAGTNGKGSTLSFLRSILESAGYLVHTYTSPHLVRFNERITLSSKEISDEFLNEILLECKSVGEKNPNIELTYFEGITAAAFLAFSKVKADVILLETGMGGLYDATNVITHNLASIITPVSFDHMQFLGTTIPEIAEQKAGIVKPNSMCIIGSQNPDALSVITKRCLELNTKPIAFDYNFNEAIIDGIDVSLLGHHQRHNASVAVACLQNQNLFTINSNHIRAGLSGARWRARLEKITSGKFFDMLPKNFELIVDGSHNEAGAKTILSYIEEETKSDVKIYIIFAMLEDKDCIGFLSKLSKKIDFLTALNIGNEAKSIDANSICSLAKSLSIKCDTANNFFHAFEKIIEFHSSNYSELHAKIFVCGSLYQAGNFLFENESK